MVVVTHLVVSVRIYFPPTVFQGVSSFTKTLKLGGAGGVAGINHSSRMLSIYRLKVSFFHDKLVGFIKGLTRGGRTPGSSQDAAAREQPRSSQGAAREHPGRPGSSQGGQGTAREQPGAARGSQEEPGRAKDSQGGQGAAREQPGKPRKPGSSQGAPREQPGAERAGQE